MERRTTPSPSAAHPHDHRLRQHGPVALHVEAVPAVQSSAPARHNRHVAALALRRRRDGESPVLAERVLHRARVEARRGGEREVTAPRTRRASRGARRR